MVQITLRMIDYPWTMREPEKWPSQPLSTVIRAGGKLSAYKQPSDPSILSWDIRLVGLKLTYRA